MDDSELDTNSKLTMDDGTSPGKNGKNVDKDKLTWNFLVEKKKVIKESQYRLRFDALAAEIDLNIINTNVSYGQKLYEKSGWGSMVFYNKMANGAYDINVYPQKLTDRDQNRSGVPVSQEPIALSKILIATSVLAGKLPDAQVIADDKVFGKAIYELWKRSWYLKGANGENTLFQTYQQLFTYGWSAWRVYPRRVQVPRKGVQKILFDDVYREPMDPKRTWLGIGTTVGDYWSQFEVLYEKDMLKTEFFAMHPDAALPKNRRKLEYCTTSQEAKDEDQEKARHSVTISYYENVLLNRYIVACGKYIMYDGELPNDESFGSVVVARCFTKNILDPYGVGLYEMMRGNTALFTYINSLNAQQVEAEIFPLLFGPQVQNGTATYKRSPNVINPKNPGTTIDVVRTNGNVQQGIAFGQQQKTAIEENTGINNIVSGSAAENTLGSTVIMKEAAQNRLTPPRNSMMNALQTDAHIATSWIQQTYPVDKVFMIDSDENLAEFAKQNPDYFIESQKIENDAGEVTGYAVAASRNLRLNFDFTPEGELMEDVPTRTISQKGLFDEMKNTGHGHSYYEFIIDPTSMLLPSLEIQKQTFMALFPIITNQLNLIFQMRKEDPENAAAQLKSLEQLLTIQKQNIYDFIPKAQYDAILAMKPSEIPGPSGEAPIDKTKIYKDAPAPVQREIEKMAGIETTPENSDIPPQTPGTIPPTKRVNNTPGVDTNNSGAPKGPNQVKRPQSPMMGAVDASLGRAGNLPFFPGGEFK